MTESVCQQPASQNNNKRPSLLCQKSMPDLGANPLLRTSPFESMASSSFSDKLVPIETDQIASMVRHALEQIEPLTGSRDSFVFDDDVDDDDFITKPLEKNKELVSCASAPEWNKPDTLENLLLKSNESMPNVRSGWPDSIKEVEEEEEDDGDKATRFFFLESKHDPLPVHTVVEKPVVFFDAPSETEEDDSDPASSSSDDDEDSPRMISYIQATFVYDDDDDDDEPVMQNNEDELEGSSRSTSSSSSRVSRGFLDAMRVEVRGIGGPISIRRSASLDSRKNNKHPRNRSSRRHSAGSASPEDDDAPSDDEKTVVTQNRSSPRSRKASLFFFRNNNNNNASSLPSRDSSAALMEEGLLTQQIAANKKAKKKAHWEALTKNRGGGGGDGGLLGNSSGHSRSSQASSNSRKSRKNYVKMESLRDDDKDENDLFQAPKRRPRKGSQSPTTDAMKKRVPPQRRGSRSPVPNKERVMDRRLSEQNGKIGSVLVQSSTVSSSVLMDFLKKRDSFKKSRSKSELSLMSKSKDQGGGSFRKLPNDHDTTEQVPSESVSSSTAPSKNQPSETAADPSIVVSHTVIGKRRKSNRRSTCSLHHSGESPASTSPKRNILKLSLPILQQSKHDAISQRDKGAWGGSFAALNTTW